MLQSWKKKLWPGNILPGLFLGLSLASLAHAFEPPKAVFIAPGSFVAGSDKSEREAAYQLDEAAYGHSVTRKNGWYDDELDRQNLSLPAFSVTRTPITNGEYAQFIRATGHRVPNVTIDEWDGYGLIHPYERTRKFAWGNGTPPEGREQHPVVLVSYEDAHAYAKWLSFKTGETWRLPNELEWEKAARGNVGHRFPWGDEFNPAKLNSHDAGPFDTVPVGSFPEGANSFGLLDAAGQVFEWTSTPSGKNRFRVKGGSWDDKGCGVCRPAARHGRPADIKHILIGFRLVQAPLTVK